MYLSLYCVLNFWHENSVVIQIAGLWVRNMLPVSCLVANYLCTMHMDLIKATVSLSTFLGIVYGFSSRLSYYLGFMLSSYLFAWMS